MRRFGSRRGSWSPVTDQADLIVLFLRPLEEAGIAYMITGGVASVIYGDPRFTRDVDLVVALPPDHVERLIRAFDAAAFYVPPAEVLGQEAARDRGGHFNLIHRETSLRGDVYVLGDDPLERWAFERRLRLRTEEVSIFAAPIEYVILRKLEYYRLSGSDRHLRDVAAMLRISGEQVDSAALGSWLDRLELRGQLEAAQRYDL